MYLPRLGELGLLGLLPEQDDPPLQAYSLEARRSISKAVLEAVAEGEKPSEEGEHLHRLLNGSEHLDFALGTLGASLGLPLGAQTNKQVMDVFKVYRGWLLTPTRRPCTGGEPEQRLVRRLLLHMSQLVQQRPGEQDPAATSDQLGLTRLLLRALLSLAREQGPTLTRPTWDCFLVSLIGVVDVVLNSPPLRELGALGVRVLLESWLRARVLSPSLWAALTRAARAGRWRQRVAATQQFEALSMALTERVVGVLYGSECGRERVPVEYSGADEADTPFLTLELRPHELFYYWDRLRAVLGPPCDVTEEPAAYLCALGSVAQQVEQFLLAARLPWERTPPTAHALLQVWGETLFEALLAEPPRDLAQDPLVMEGRALAMAALCRIFTQTQNLHWEVADVAPFFQVMVLHLTKKRPDAITNALLQHLAPLFLVGLPGVVALLPPVVGAIGRIWGYTRIKTVPVPVRLACAELVCTLTALPSLLASTPLVPLPADDAPALPPKLPPLRSGADLAPHLRFVLREGLANEKEGLPLMRLLAALEHLALEYDQPSAALEAPEEERAAWRELLLLLAEKLERGAWEERVQLVALEVLAQVPSPLVAPLGPHLVPGLLEYALARAATKPSLAQPALLAAAHWLRVDWVRTLPDPSRTGLVRAVVQALGALTPLVQEAARTCLRALLGPREGGLGGPGGPGGPLAEASLLGLGDEGALLREGRARWVVLDQDRVLTLLPRPAPAPLAALVVRDELGQALWEARFRLFADGDSKTFPTNQLSLPPVPLSPAPPTSLTLGAWPEQPEAPLPPLPPQPTWEGAVQHHLEVERRVLRGRGYGLGGEVGYVPPTLTPAPDHHARLLLAHLGYLDPAHLPRVTPLAPSPALLRDLRTLDATPALDLLLTPVLLVPAHARTVPALLTDQGGALLALLRTLGQPCREAAWAEREEERLWLDLQPGLVHAHDVPEAGARLLFLPAAALSRSYSTRLTRLLTLRAQHRAQLMERLREQRAQHHLAQWMALQVALPPPPAHVPVPTPTLDLPPPPPAPVSGELFDFLDDLEGALITPRSRTNLLPTPAPKSIPLPPVAPAEDKRAQVLAEGRALPLRPEEEQQLAAWDAAQPELEADEDAQAHLERHLLARPVVLLLLEDLRDLRPDAPFLTAPCAAPGTLFLVLHPSKEGGLHLRLVSHAGGRLKEGHALLPEALHVTRPQAPTLLRRLLLRAHRLHASGGEALAPKEPPTRHRRRLLADLVLRHSAPLPPAELWATHLAPSLPHPASASPLSDTPLTVPALAPALRPRSRDPDYLRPVPPRPPARRPTVALGALSPTAPPKPSQPAPPPVLAPPKRDKEARGSISGIIGRAFVKDKHKEERKKEEKEDKKREEAQRKEDRPSPSPSPAPTLVPTPGPPTPASAPTLAPPVPASTPAPPLAVASPRAAVASPRPETPKANTSPNPSPPAPLGPPVAEKEKEKEKEKGGLKLSFDFMKRSNKDESKKEKKDKEKKDKEDRKK